MGVERRPTDLDHRGSRLGHDGRQRPGLRRNSVPTGMGDHVRRDPAGSGNHAGELVDGAEKLMTSAASAGRAGPGHPPDETARPPYLSETTL